MARPIWTGTLSFGLLNVPVQLITADRLNPSFTANLNGDRFISDPCTRLGKSDSVLILSADAGG